MKVLLQSNGLVLVPEAEEERAALAAWKVAHADFAFATVANSGGGATLTALGRRVEVCREPINVTSNSPDPIRLIANFAPTPFELDGECYACERRSGRACASRSRSGRALPPWRGRWRSRYRRSNPVAVMSSIAGTRSRSGPSITGN